MPHNPRHIECPDGCGQNVWRFHSKRLEQDYYCDTNSHRNYHVCPDEEPPLKVKPKEPGKMVEVDMKADPVNPLTLFPEAEFETGEEALKLQQGFRLLEVRISKGRRIGSETIPELPEFRHFDYFQSRNIAVDDRDMDIKELIRRQYLEIDTTIIEQIAQDRAKVIQALDAQQRK